MHTSLWSGVDPTTSEEAVKKEKWKNAIKEELAAIWKNNTTELMDLPKDKKAIGVKWILRTKCQADGSIQRHKVRLKAYYSLTFIKIHS